MRIEDLSVNERILIHLRDFSTDPVSEGAQIGQTQEGIGEAVGIRINHVPRATKALMEGGYADEALVHIGGLKRKRKAFFLMPAGLEVANKLLAKLRSQKVRFRDAESCEADVPVQEAARKMMGATPSQIILAFFREGVVLQSGAAGQAKSACIEAFGDVQVPEGFVDREGETSHIAEGLSSGLGLIVVSGMKGIGKTSLVRKALCRFEGRKNLFWYSLHEWDTPRSMLEHISDFYVRLGRNEGKRVLRQFRDLEVGQAASAMAKDMRDSDSILVLDNVFGLKRESMHLVCHLAEQVQGLSGSALVLITRDREALETSRCMMGAGPGDLTVKGLERGGAMALMRAMGMSEEDSDRVFAMTQGHPLAIKLVNSEEINKVIDTKGLTGEEVWVVRCMKAFDAIFDGDQA